MKLPDSYYNMYSSVKNTDRRSNLGLISMMDDAIGDIYDKLDELDLLDDTLIFFTSDNGGACAAGGQNYPLRGCKDTLFEGGQRVRSFVYGKSLTSYVNSGLFHAVDFTPTIIGAALESTSYCNFFLI